METTDEELSKELYELSGWKTKLKYFHTYDNSDDTWVSEVDGANGVFVCYVYDLGYLIRRLPVQTIIKREYDASPELPEETPAHYRCIYDTADGRHFWLGADTPEDAAAKVAIELFKHGILKREE